MDRKIAVVTCFAFGLVMFAQYFSAHPLAHSVNQTIADYWQIIFAFALIVGVVGFLNNNLQQVHKGQDRPFRLLALAGFVIMPVLAMIWGIKAGTPFLWVFENVQVPLQSTVFALLAFFVASASFRGFRARSVPAAILLSAALIILISRSFATGPLSDWLPGVAEWIRNNPSMAARRGILIGIGLGSLTTSLRVILGIERTWLGGAK